MGWEWTKIFINKKRIIGADPIEDNELDGTELYQGLVGPFNGKIFLNIEKTGIGASSTMVMSESNLKECDMISWKNFCKLYNIDKISILKINIEGGEYPLLNSMDIDDFNKIDQIAVSLHDWINPKWTNLTKSTLNLLEKSGFESTLTCEAFGWYLALKKY